MFLSCCCLFFFNYTATTEIYTLSLHDALPICILEVMADAVAMNYDGFATLEPHLLGGGPRSEEHTSELQSRGHLVCRLLLEKKKNSSPIITTIDNHNTPTHYHSRLCARFPRLN